MLEQGEMTATVLAGSDDNASARGPDEPRDAVHHASTFSSLHHPHSRTPQSLVFCCTSHGFAVVDETCSHAMMALLGCTGALEALQRCFHQYFPSIFPTPSLSRAQQPSINCPVFYGFATIWNCFLIPVPIGWNLTAASHLVRLSCHQTLIIANASPGITTFTNLLLATKFFVASYSNV